MNIKIDDKIIQVNDPSKNIVEIAEENGITITAPCFRNKKKHGCCNVCVVEADGKQAYACNLKAKDGMEIIYNREDLSQLRKERLDQYAEAIKSGDTSQNTCGGTDPRTFSTSASCGCSSGSKTSCCG